MTHRPRRIVALAVAAAVTMLTMSGSRSVIAMSGAGRLSPGVGRVFRPGIAAAVRPGSPRLGAVSNQSSPRDARGATTTRLADGRWLVAGGATADGPVATAAVIDPSTGRVTPIAGLQVARTGHSATLLADGMVLIAGGRGAAGELVTTAEVFDPRSATFLPVTIAGARARTDHTATLLTDGHVVIAGGAGLDGPLGDAEVWDVSTATANAAAGVMTAPRGQHEAELLADGRVRISRGLGADGLRIEPIEIFDPATGQFALAAAPAIDRSAPRLVASIPANGAQDVPLDVRVALRFSRPLLPESVTAASIGLSGPDSPVEVTLVAAEGGRLVFVAPRVALLPDTTYLVSIDGAVDARGVPVLPTTVTLTTKASERPADVPDEEAWTPDRSKGWKSHRPDSPWRKLKPLEAPPGVTALAGQVLRLDGLPLPDVTLEMEEHTTRTDRTGRFLLLLDGVTTGEHTLDIDARTANRPNRTYGFYEVRWTITAGRTNVLPFTIWSPLLDTAHQVTIPSPTTQETIVTTPVIPGLELHLPAGTTIIDEDHEVVRTVSITPIPLDRTPFPLPDDATFTMFFTIQPGGAYVRTTGPSKGAWLVYPKRTDHAVGAKLPFFNYDPDDKGWFVYGLGTVTPTRVAPDPPTRLYAFTGASFDSGPQPAQGGGSRGGGKDGDPVDPATGAFLMEKTDLYLPDVMPLALTRTYNSMDTDPANVRPFGIGMTHAYGLFQWSANQFAEGDLVLPDGGRVHYTRISNPNDPWYTTVMECQGEPTAFYTSRLRFDGTMWEYTLKDGTQYILGHSAPLQKIRDRYGNETRLTWSQTNIFGAGYGNLLRITSPNGRWIAFTYDTNAPVNRITDATDNIGRTVHYTYDANGHLETVTDPEGNVTTYTWDANHRMKTITDGRNIVYLTNEYDASGRVQKQTLADPAAQYTFAYTTDGNGNITRTDITNPRGFIKRLTYNAGHYLTSEIEALNQPEQRTTTIEREAGSNLVTAIRDGLLRRTEYTYDDSGHVLTVKRLADTPNPVTTTFTYEPKFFQLATLTDPLNHTWTTSYDALGRISSTTDPLSHQVTLSTDAQGRVTSMTTALQHTWQFGYTGADRTSTTNPLGDIWRSFTDGAGRVLSTTDPLGRVTRFVPNKLNRVTTVSDALNSQTAFGYDANSNLVSLTDALTHATTYTYDSDDRVATRRDALLQTARYFYDANNNLTQTIDRKGHITTREYDALDRLTRVRYADASTTEYQYDGGDRLRQVVDSVGGTITRDYDMLDRLTSETTPEGTVSYTHGADGRPETMTVTGQTQVVYDYDDAHRLTSITQGTSIVAFTYDNADRRSTMTLPNAIVATYGYDNANQLTSLTYALGQITLGSLTYTYDAAGNRTNVGGSWARTGLPQAVTSTTYDAANRLIEWDAQSLRYDQDGNLVSGGAVNYQWDAQNRLIGLSGEISASFQYDGLNRRRSKTSGGIGAGFLYDGVNLVQEISGSTPTATVLTGVGIDDTFARTDNFGSRFLLTDALGSTIALTDSSGAPQTEYTFEPFGAAIVTGAPATNAVQFTGRENDGTSLYYYRARFYEPVVGRFTSEDPIGFAGDVNLYAYVRNNPITRTDALGLQGSAKQTNGRGTGYDPRNSAAWWWWYWAERGDDVGWRYAHCMASCQGAKWSWEWASNAMGYANEILQLTTCFASGSPAACQSGWAGQDFKDNAYGRSCPQNMSCEERCKDLLGENKSADQYGPLYGWPGLRLPGWP